MERLFYGTPVLQNVCSMEHLFYRTFVLVHVTLHDCMLAVYCKDSCMIDTLRLCRFSCTWLARMCVCMASGGHAHTHTSEQAT